MGPWQGGLGRAREQHPICLLHSQPYIPSSATIPSISLPWGAWGHTHGHRGQDRAVGNPGSSPSPDVGFSVIIDWGHGWD